MDRTASTRDEGPAYAGSTPDAPPIAPPGGGDAFEPHEGGTAPRPGKQPEAPVVAYMTCVATVGPHHSPTRRPSPAQDHIGAAAPAS